MNLTKRKALEECIKMWTWLSKYPEAGKFDYFTAMKINNIPEDECYCCEYAINNQRIKDCTCCPIWKGAEFPVYGCYSKNSPYYKWVDTVTSKDSSYYANEIVKLAQEALDKLNKEN